MVIVDVIGLNVVAVVVGVPVWSAGERSQRSINGNGDGENPTVTVGPTAHEYSFINISQKYFFHPKLVKLGIVGKLSTRLKHLDTFQALNDDPKGGN